MIGAESIFRLSTKGLHEDMPLFQKIQNFKLQKLGLRIYFLIINSYKLRNRVCHNNP